MAVHLDLINRFNLNGSGTSLNGPTRFATVVEAGKTYVYVVDLDGDAVIRYQMLSDGSLIYTSQLVNSASTSLNGPVSIVAAQAGGQTYLYVNSFYDDSITVLSVDAAGDFTVVETIIDDATLELDGTDLELTVATGQDGPGHKLPRHRHRAGSSGLCPLEEPSTLQVHHPFRDFRTRPG